MDNNLLDYYGKLSSEQKETLLNLRREILNQAPGAIEVFSYGMPVYKYKDKYLIGINAARHHYAIYPGSEPIEKLKDELTSYSTSKGTIRFTKEKPMDSNLLIKIIEICKSRI